MTGAHYNARKPDTSGEFMPVVLRHERIVEGSVYRRNVGANRSKRKQPFFVLLKSIVAVLRSKSAKSMLNFRRPIDLRTELLPKATIPHWRRAFPSPRIRVPGWISHRPYPSSPCGINMEINSAAAVTPNQFGWPWPILATPPGRRLPEVDLVGPRSSL